MTKNTPLTLVGGRFAVVKGATIDTRKSERARAAGQPAGPIDGRNAHRGDLLEGGDMITADDLEGGAGQLQHLIAQGMVVRLDEVPSISPKSGLVVAPGRSTISDRGVLGPGAEVHPHDFRRGDLEQLIERGVVIRTRAATGTGGSTPPEAA